jgi:putative addiction module killer protein
LTFVAQKRHHPRAGRKTDEYAQWIDALRDQAIRARILVRIERLINGNPGEHRNLADGVSELKIDFGPGYRVYYAQRGARLLLLLAGGDKSSQSKDIRLALELARSFKE